MKTIITAFTAVTLLIAISCNKELQPTEDQANLEMRSKMPNMDVYYDAELFRVNMKEMPGNASKNLINHNGSINEIYTTDDLDEEQDFIPVIDAIHGDGFNPLWRQILIEFNDGFVPHQFFSDTEIEEAADNGEITLIETDEVYRCSIIGSPH